jgi:hypothetical protein
MNSLLLEKFLMPKPDKIDLPFVKDDPDWKRKSGVAPRDFWTVETTGKPEVDSRLGNDFALQLLDYINEHDGWSYLLGWAVFDMIAKAEKSATDDKMIIFGFMEEIAHHAAYGRKILKDDEKLMPGAMMAIFKDPATGRQMS